MSNQEIKYPISMPDYDGVLTYQGNDFVWDKDTAQWALVVADN